MMADAYVIVMFGTLVVGLAAACGLLIDAWPAIRNRAEAHRSRAWQATRLILIAHAYGDLVREGRRRGVIRSLFNYPRGTVQNPTDPSPRIRHLIAAGIRQQDADAELRARAEGEAQR